MPGQQDDEAARIAAHHLPRLTNMEQAIVAARCRNRSAEDIGKLVGLSKRQVERMVTSLTYLISIPLGYDHHGWLPGEWAFVHAGCCLADGRKWVCRAG